MPGITGSIGSDLGEDGKRFLRPACSEYKESDHWFLGRQTIPKFLEDKPFFEDDQYLFLIEGVILNRLTLQERYQTGSFQSTIIAMYHALGDTFFNAFRGSFSGVFFHKQENKWLIFTDHLGDKQLFYSSVHSTLHFSWEPRALLAYRRANGLPITPNRDAIYMILTYGFLLEDNTLSQEVKKLTAGHYLAITKGLVEEKQYHRFKNEPDYGKSPEEWIEQIDHYFRKAVKLQFDKDREYGYKHITTLSGGLDSRMTVWVAHELGYTEQLNTTFSQSDYLDESIAKAIATDLKHEWLFKALDHGNFLKDIDAIAQITYGAGSYAGLAHGKSLYDLVNFEKFGIMHTGQIGDAILGTFYKKPVAGLQHKIGDGAYSLGMIDRLTQYHFKYQYDNVEIFSLYSRAFTGANQGLLVFQEHTESISPFTDVDFINLCYSIPVELRHNHKIYIDWILAKYPGAAAYPWEKIKGLIKPITAYETVNIFGKRVPKGSVTPWLMGAVKRRLPFKWVPRADTSFSTKNHMNPLDYWLINNTSLAKYVEEYFQKNIQLIEDKQLVEDYTALFKHGSISETFQVLTCLSGLKILLNK